MMNEIETEDGYEDFSEDKKCLMLVIIQLSQNIMMKRISCWQDER